MQTPPAIDSDDDVDADFLDTLYSLGRKTPFGTPKAGQHGGQDCTNHLAKPLACLVIKITVEKRLAKVVKFSCRLKLLAKLCMVQIAQREGGLGQEPWPQGYRVMYYKNGGGVAVRRINGRQEGSTQRHQECQFVAMYFGHLARDLVEDGLLLEQGISAYLRSALNSHPSRERLRDEAPLNQSIVQTVEERVCMFAQSVW